MRAATAIDIVDTGEIPVPFSINTRTSATICKATKKKIVGGSSKKTSFLGVVDILVINLNSDDSYRFPCFLLSRRVGRAASGAFQNRRDQVIKKRGGGRCEPPAVK